jgi:hypothetical protein
MCLTPKPNNGQENVYYNIDWTIYAETPEKKTGKALNLEVQW